MCSVGVVHLLMLIAAYCCTLLSFMQSVTKDAAGQVTGVTAELNLAGDFKKTKLKLTWLADVPDLVPLTLTEFDYLITKKKVSSCNGLSLLVSWGDLLALFSCYAAPVVCLKVSLLRVVV